MITAVVIFGKEAVRYFENEGKIPNKEWLNAVCGSVQEIEFETLAEFQAYQNGLEDGNGWEEVKILTPETITDSDCPHCQDWRSYFSDRETTVYCPDCAKEIITPITYDTISFNGKEYQVRRVDLPGFRDNAIIGTDDLCMALIKDCEPISHEAEQLDDEIIFYVQPDKLKLSNEELIKHVLENIG